MRDDLAVFHFDAAANEAELRAGRRPELGAAQADRRGVSAQEAKCSRVAHGEESAAFAFEAGRESPAVLQQQIVGRGCHECALHVHHGAPPEHDAAGIDQPQGGARNVTGQGAVDQRLQSAGNASDNVAGRAIGRERGAFSCIDIELEKTVEQVFADPRTPLLADLHVARN